jgi:hypothetical protein
MNMTAPAMAGRAGAHEDRGEVGGELQGLGHDQVAGPAADVADLGGGERRASKVIGRAGCRGAWARVTIDQFRHLALQPCQGHMISMNILANQKFKYV